MSKAAVIEVLDRMPLPPTAWRQVALEVVSHAGFNDAETCQMLRDYKERRLNGWPSTPLATAVAAKRLDSTLSEYERSKASLLACLVPVNHALDGYGAEYLFLWGKDVGVSEAAVVAALRRAMSS